MPHVVQNDVIGRVAEDELVKQSRAEGRSQRATMLTPGPLNAV